MGGKKTTSLLQMVLTTPLAQPNWLAQVVFILPRG